MTLRCHPDLERVAVEATVDSPTSFTIGGRRFNPDRSDLLRVLESELYLRLYCGSPEPHTSRTEDPDQATAFVGALSRANTGAGTWEPGWRIRGRDGSAVTVVRDGVTFWAEREQVRTASGKAAPGALCSVRIGKELRDVLSGFYMALGNLHPGDQSREPAPLVRLYWHLTSGIAVRYMKAATRGLNEAGIPFETKVLANPGQYVRRDSGVLYLRKDDFDRAAPIVKATYERVREGLSPAVPLFTKPLAPGLALAEDPGHGLSFGQSRCRVAARGLWQCHSRGLTEAELRLGAIAAAFRAEGLDPERPYLEPGSTDTYDLALASGTGGTGA